MEERECFSREIIRVSDGSELAVFSCGSREAKAIVLCNAFPVSVTIMEPLAKRLNKDFFTVTWETRGLHGIGDFDPENCGISVQVRDLIDVLDHFDIHDPLPVVGYCNGAEVALTAAYMYPNRVEKLFLLNGYFSFEGPMDMLEKEKAIYFILEQAARSKGFAESYYKMLLARRHSQATEWTEDPRLREAATAAFYRCPESVYRYALMLARYPDNHIERWIHEVESECMVIGATADQMVHPNHSRKIMDYLKNGQLIMREGADHYAIYTDEEIATLIKNANSV